MDVSGHSKAEQVSFWNAAQFEAVLSNSSGYCQSALVSITLKNEGTLGDK